MATTKAKSAPRADMIEKEPTSLHVEFADWLENETGYKTDLKSVQLATVLRMDFQRSPQNQSRLTSNKQAKENEAKARAEKKAAAAKAKAEKAAAPAKAAAPKAAKPAPKTAPAAKASTAKAPVRRRAAAKA